MYLKSLKLTNYRSFDTADIHFRDDLTVLVGENNGGKSNAIDAIRLITTPLSGRRDIYCEITDIRFETLERKFEIEASFAGLTVPQRGRLLSATADASLETATFGLTYDASTNGYSGRPVLWAGPRRMPPEPGCHETIRHVYLPPLRDAKRALASGNPTRIFALLKHFLGGEAPDDLASRLRRTGSDAVLARVDTAVDANLNALTSGVRQQGAALGFADDEKLIDIARDLRFKLADHGIRPEDLRYSGHGYANLLYMATIAVELEKVKDADLTLFLVEEPEAHLHPQLQAAVLTFLEEQAEKSKVVDPANLGPAGQIQVIVATHSPNLSAWVTSSNLVVIKTIVAPPAPAPAGGATADPVPVTAQAPAGTPPLPTEAPPGPTRRMSRCLALGTIGLTDPERRKVDRYLDVTRSALLFGGRILLVEGIAEALLLPVIAKHHVLKGQTEKWRVFRSAVFVPIDGVDFEPYAKLLLTEANGIRIADRVVIVTDGDAQKAEAGKTPAGFQRKIDLDAIGVVLNAGSLLSVFTNTYSLETELITAGNTDLLKNTYLAVHPRSEDKWTEAVGKTGKDQAIAVQALFKDTRKGDFAQRLAEEIRKESTAFHVPAYLHDAIRAVVT